jgi:AcrR family transcriptional regulator
MQIMSKNKLKSKEGAFERLDKLKREKIIHACVEEFAEAGYALASTNKIAKKAGVAKGSLFKYFGTKENLFFAVASHVLNEYLAHLRKEIPKMPPDILDRFVIMQDKIYDFFAESPVMFRFFTRVLRERGGAVQFKIREKWEPLTEPLFMEFLDGADMSRLKVSPKELIQIVTWIDTAIDMDVMDTIRPDTTVEELKKTYRQKMMLAYKVLKTGIYK